MRIAHVITSLGTGGAEKLVVQLSNKLSKGKNKVKIISITGERGIPYELLDKKLVELIELNYNNLKNPKIALDIYKYTKDCDLVHTHTFYAQFYSSIFISKNRLITTEHNTSNRRRGKLIFKFIDYIMYYRYKKIVCITEETKINLNKWIKNTTEKSTVINNGIDIKKYKEAIGYKKSDYFDEESFILVCVAGFRHQKNQDILIDVIKELPKEVKLLLVGDGNRRNILEQKICDNGVSKRVKILGNRNDVENLLKMSDVFILPSIYEGFGLVAVEAAAAGLPLILSNCDGLKQLFEIQEINLFDHDDRIGLINCITKIKSSIEKDNRTVGYNNLYKYDISNMFSQYITLYCDMEK